MNDVLIDSKGIKRALKKYDYSRAICEYIWNGFDASASKIDIQVDSNVIGNISVVTINDNGNGIPFNLLDEKFRPFLRSEKEINPDQYRNSSNVHGINGVGRLTFYKFATNANWYTVFEENGKRYKYSINVNSKSLNHYSTTPVVDTQEEPGTLVQFTGIFNITAEHFTNEIIDFLKKEFCWFLELNTYRNFEITFNGEQLDISSEIIDEGIFHYTDQESGFKFAGKFLQWKGKLHYEYSRNYFLDSTGKEKFKKTTTFNNKGDDFYHSLYIYSAFFDKVEYVEYEDENNEKQMRINYEGDSQKEVFSRLMEEVNQFLKEKRNPFIEKLSDQLVKDYTSNGIFPEIGNDEWGKIRENELKDFVRQLYIVEPKMFSRLNTEQQKSFILLLNLVMDSNEKDDLLFIIDQVVRLNPEERKQLSNVLQTSKLSNITKTIALIQDRLKAVSELRQLIEKDFGAYESKHIQKFIESHYWLFGEQYHLATAEEPDFEDALRKYVFMTTGEDIDAKIAHPDKNKEMDIFAIRKLRLIDEFENIVIELKRPTVTLGEKELSQIKGYSRVIKSDPRFNNSNAKWTFYLVGNKYDSTGYIEGEISSNKNHGEKFLVFANENIKIYVLKWSEVISSFELRYSHLVDELKVERERLIKKHDTPDDIIEDIKSNSAAIKNEQVSIII